LLTVSTSIYILSFELFPPSVNLQFVLCHAATSSSHQKNRF
jgi:hypothetical protein